MPSDLVGTWESVQHDPDTAEAMYKELGVNFILRKAAKFFKAGCEIGHHGDTWSIKTIAPFKDHTIEFKMGVPIKFDSLDGRKVEATYTMEEEDTIVEIQRWDGKTLKCVRKLDGKDTLVITMTTGAVTFEVVYKRKSG